MTAERLARVRERFENFARDADDAIGTASHAGKLLRAWRAGERLADALAALLNVSGTCDCCPERPGAKPVSVAGTPLWLCPACRKKAGRPTEVSA